MQPANRENARKILVIEDEPDIVRGLRDALEFEGFAVLSQGTGSEGLQAAAEWASQNLEKQDPYHVEPMNATRSMS